MIRFGILLALASALAVALAQRATSEAGVSVRDLGDGFVRLDTPAYTLEVPKGWAVSRETSFGQRTMESGKSQMTAMTAGGPVEPNWDRLYQTSLYFIRRENPGKPTPYKISKSAQGYEACSFSILDEDGFASARYVILRNKEGRILALSVKIPEKRKERELQRAFDRMIRTAVVK